MSQSQSAAVSPLTRMSASVKEPWTQSPKSPTYTTSATDDGSGSQTTESAFPSTLIEQSTSTPTTESSTSSSRISTERPKAGSPDSVSGLDESDLQARCTKAQKKRSQQELTLENTEEDTKRILLESRKLKKELEVLQAKKTKLEAETAKLKSERESYEMKKNILPT